MKKLLRKLAALVSLGAFCSTMMSGLPVGAEINVPKYATGDLLTPEEALGQIETQTNDEVSTIGIEDVPILSFYDLSVLPYFPPIGDQGRVGSCVAWATTYYQFTYEANKLNNITTTYQNSYSPAWVFNFTNNGTGGGSNYQQAYTVLKKQGALKMCDFPYDGYNYSHTWSTDTDAMIEALETRLTGEHTKKITTSTNKITSATDTQLNEVKQLLCAGKLLTVRVKLETSQNGIINWEFKETNNNQGLAVCYATNPDPDNTSGHMLTIVGYDNSIECDINGNNIIEANEKGAFKVANSWGTSWGNNGYIWVMYDALNHASAGSLLVNNRISVFDRIATSESVPENVFYYIDVENIENVNLIGLVTFTTNYRYNMNMYTNRCVGTSYSTTNQNQVIKSIQKYDDNNNLIPPVIANYQGTIALDFGNLDDNIGNYLSGYTWFVNIVNLENGGNITNASLKFVDNKNNLVKNVSLKRSVIASGTSSTLYSTLSLMRGDVNYSNSLSEEDATMLLNFAVDIDDASDLQAVLSDYNQDGYVNSRDVAALRGALSATEAAAFDETITEMYHQIQNNTQVMSADLTDDETEKYIEIVTELYFEFVQEG